MPYLVVDENIPLKVDASDFVPMRLVDTNFNNKLQDLTFTGEDQNKEVKLGKVISQYYNCGIALIDISKVDKLGGNALYRLGDHRAVVWQPTWLDMVRKK